MGIEVVEENLLFMIDMKNKEYKKIQVLNIDDNMDIEIVEEAVKPFVNKYEEQLKQGMWLFTADKLSNGEYDATYKISYAEWLLTSDNFKEHPYSYDITDANEKVVFNHVVNGNSVESYGMLVYEAINPKEMDLP
ncbi:TPA: hypothetical protein QC364_000768 [Bacillus cereus]|nr:hypothetical protein [Bacillus cereus]